MIKGINYEFVYHKYVQTHTNIHTYWEGKKTERRAEET